MPEVEQAKIQSRGCKRSCDKGNRVERIIVKALQEHGLGAERLPLSGWAGGFYTEDLTVPALGRDHRVEVEGPRQRLPGTLRVTQGPRRARGQGQSPRASIGATAALGGRDSGHGRARSRAWREPAPRYQIMIVAEQLAAGQVQSILSGLARAQSVRFTLTPSGPLAFTIERLERVYIARDPYRNVIRTSASFSETWWKRPRY